MESNFAAILPIFCTVTQRINVILVESFINNGVAGFLLVFGLIIVEGLFLFPVGFVGLHYVPPNLRKIATWDDWEVQNEEVEEIATKFIFANCYNQKIAGDILQNRNQKTPKIQNPQCQISKTQNPQGLVEHELFTNLAKIL